MPAPKPKARLKVASQQIYTAINLLEQLAEEELHMPEATDEAVVSFLLDQAQSAVGKARSHIRVYFATGEAE